jgi:hypothetical protein
VEEEEAGEAKVADRRQLLLEPCLGLGTAARAGVALGKSRTADLGEVAVCARRVGTRVAIASEPTSTATAAARTAAAPPPSSRLFQVRAIADSKN